MGGHGGLNILPQKRWNVWRQDNREKVLQDEKKHAEEQAAIRKKQEQAEREYRRNKLLARVRGAEELQRESGGLVRVDEQDAEPLTRDGDDRGDGRFDLGLGKEHINLFGLSDARNGPDEAVAEAKREEARRRGREDQRTSDARFDAQFRLGRQLGQDEPWWVDGGMALQARRELDAARRDAEARQRQAASASGGPLAVGAVAESDLRMERARREREEARRERALLASRGIRPGRVGDVSVAPGERYLEGRSAAGDAWGQGGREGRERGSKRRRSRSPSCSPSHDGSGRGRGDDRDDCGSRGGKREKRDKGERRREKREKKDKKQKREKKERRERKDVRRSEGG